MKPLERLEVQRKLQEAKKIDSDTNNLKLWKTKKETKNKASLVSKAGCHHPVSKSPLEVYACTAI